MNCFRFVVQSELHSTHASADQTGTSTTSGRVAKERRLNCSLVGTARTSQLGKFTIDLYLIAVDNSYLEQNQVKTVEQ